MIRWEAEVVAADGSRYLAVDDATFDRPFGGNALLGVTGGTSAMLELIV